MDQVGRYHAEQRKRIEAGDSTVLVVVVRGITIGSGWPAASRPTITESGKRKVGRGQRKHKGGRRREGVRKKCLRGRKARRKEAGKERAGETPPFFLLYFILLWTAGKKEPETRRSRCCGRIRRRRRSCRREKEEEEEADLAGKRSEESPGERD